MLLDHRGQEIKKSVYGLDPLFLRGILSTGNGIAEVIGKRPYALHAWVYACVKKIVDNLATIPRILVNKNQPDDAPIKEHPLLSLFLQPNPYMCGSDFFEALFLSLLLPSDTTQGGQAFVVGERNESGATNFYKGEIPSQLYVFDDRLMHPVVSRGTLTGWKLEVPGEPVLPYTLDEVIRVRLMNPYELLQGLSPYSAGSVAVGQDSQSDEYNTQYFTNSGAIGGLLSSDSDLTRDQMRDYLQSWREQTAGAGNNGRTMIMGKGLKYNQFARSNTDMQFAELKDENRSRILAVYGVPESELTVFESGMNRATAEQAARNFWEKTLLPLDRRVMSALNIKWVSHMRPEGLELKPDISTIPAMQEDVSLRIDQAKKLFDMGVPAAEAFRVAGVRVNTEEYPWLETTFVPSTSVDAQGLYERNGKPKPPEATPEPTKAVEGAFVRAMDKLSEASEKAAKRREAHGKMWGAYVKAVLDPGEKDLRAKMDAFFRKLRNTMLEKVDKWAEKQKSMADIVSKAAGDEYNADPATFLFSVDEANRVLLDIYEPTVEAQMKRAKADLEATSDVGFGWKVNPENIEKFVDKRKDILEQINTTTHGKVQDDINALVKEAVDEGWTTGKLAKELRKQINADMSVRITNVSTIARTETSAITNYAREEMFEDSGIEETEWVSAGDELVRTEPHNHAIDGEIRKMGDAFSNGLRYPHDPEGEASNVINCRCTTLPVK